MKKSLFLCLAVTFLLFAAGCSEEELFVPVTAESVEKPVYMK